MKGSFPIHVYIIIWIESSAPRSMSLCTATAYSAVIRPIPYIESMLACMQGPACMHARLVGACVSGCVMASIASWYRPRGWPAGLN